MAPYTMSIIIKDPPRHVNYIGSTRLKGDGYVTSTGRNVEVGTTAEGASLAKGGGTEGLFIATIFSLSDCSENLLVWSSMSAAADGEVIVKIAFVDPDLSITSLANTCYYEPDKLGLNDRVVAKKGALGTDVLALSAILEHCDKKYPNSTCTVTFRVFGMGLIMSA